MNRKNTWNSLWIWIVLGLFFAYSYTAVEVKAAELPVVPVQIENTGASSVEPTSISLPAGQDDAAAILTVKMSHSGVLHLLAAGSKNTKLRLYADAACKNAIGAEIVLTGEAQVLQRYIPIAKAGTYYLRYSNVQYASSVVRSAAVYAYGYDGDDKVLSDGKWAVTYTQNSAKTVYHKIVLKKPAFVRFAGSVRQPSSAVQTMGTLKVNLCNSKKKVISGGISLDADGKFLALKKGTYYISLKQKDMAMLCYTAQYVNEKSGAKKAKAVKLKKNKQVAGVLTLGEAKKKADWYKITLSKKGKIRCDLANYGPNAIKIQIIPKNKKVKMKKGTSKVGAQKGLKLTSKSKLPAGTYYLKIYKNSKTASSYYTLKCKYK